MIQSLTRGQIKDIVTSLTHNEAPEILALVDKWISEIHSEIQDFTDFPWLRSDDGRITLLEGIETYALPQGFVKMGDHYAFTIDGQPVHAITEAEFLEQYYSDQSAPGFPQYYRLFGKPVFVARQSANASKITVVSSTADTASVLVKGIDDDGFSAYEEIELDGVSPKEGSIIFKRGGIHSITLGDDCAGFVTAKDSAGVSLLRIPPGIRAIAYNPIKFYPVPDSTVHNKIARFSFYESIPDLISDSDVSIVPDMAVLSDGVLLRLYQFRGDDAKVALYRVKYEEGKMRLAGQKQKARDRYQQIKPIFQNPRVIS